MQPATGSEQETPGPSAVRADTRQQPPPRKDALRPAKTDQPTNESVDLRRRLDRASRVFAAMRTELQDALEGVQSALAYRAAVVRALAVKENTP